MNLSVDLAGVTLKNPVMTASGTFGSGQEFSEFVDLNQLGAVVTKGVAYFRKSDFCHSLYFKNKSEESKR